MNQHFLFIILIFLLFFKVQAQGLQPSSDDRSPYISTSFRPSIAVVIGVLSIMFSLTLLLLIYAKFCHTATSDFIHPRDAHDQPTALIRSRRFSGIDKAVIESLPFFRFSSLRGSKEGLECAVCLSKFEETETLRLLPKCKHAFHVNCVDQWLQSHSSCPLCRLKIDVEDITIFRYSSSRRISPTQSNLTEDPNLELFVRREPEDQGSSRFSVGSSFRMMETEIQERTAVQESANVYEDNDGKTLMDKSVHKIKVTDAVVNNGWSDVHSGDLLFLNSEMLNNTTTNRFPSSNSSNAPSSTHEKAIKLEQMDKTRLLEIKRIDRSYSVSGSDLPSTSGSEAILNNNSRTLIPTEKRSMSEIINLSRFVDHFGLNPRSKESPSDSNSTREENMRRLWSPIARRTAEWFAGREKRSKQSQYSRQLSIV